MAEPVKYDAQLDDLLQRARKAIRRGHELIAKAQELKRQCDRLRAEKRSPHTA